MQLLPEALSGLAEYQQFILWKPIPRDDGRVDKVPVNYATGVKHDAHDPAIWLSFDHAVHYANHYDCSVGFTISAQDPFFFIDVDNCISGSGQYTQIAQELCTRFSGAAIEISQSQRGLHILGKGAAPAARKKQATDANEKELFVLFTEKRFVALTGISAIGNVSLDHTAAITELCRVYLPAEAGIADVDWNSEPSEGWDGPVDDDVLINKILLSQSIAGVLGSKCSIQALWSADEKTLHRFFPDDRDLRAFDWSKADQALCQHLAFWTGKNCERMNDIFMRSGLYREKWAIREDYRISTIVKAVSNCNTVYNQNYGKSDETPPPPSGTDTDRYITPTSQQELFKGCVYIRDIHRIMTPDGGFLRSEQFKVMYGGYTFVMDLANRKQTNSAFETFTESQAIDFPKVHSSCFRPELPPGQIIKEEGRTLVNSYVAVETVSSPGDVSRFLKLVSQLLPVEHDRNILLAYMAAVVQYPGVKFQWCPVIQGAEGNGKSLLMTAVARAVGVRYTHKPHPNDIGNVFNAWIVNKLFIAVEEVYFPDKKEIIESIKPLITDDRVPVTPKGVDQITGDNRANFMMCTNHKDAIIKTLADRRYCILFTAQQTLQDIINAGMTGGYIPRLYDWFNKEDGQAFVTNYLQNYKIPDELNPATGCRDRAPVTSTTAEAIKYSLGALEQEILEAIDEGRPGFANGWVSSMAFDRMLETWRGSAKKLSHVKRREVMESLGYVLHPHLQNGRAIHESPIDRGKPRLYIKIGHIHGNLQTGREILDRYLEAQDYKPSGIVPPTAGVNRV